jgi:hypothetical protein
MMPAILREIILRKLFTDFIGRNTHHGVLTRIEIRRELKELYSDRPFLQ